VRIFLAVLQVARGGQWGDVRGEVRLKEEGDAAAEGAVSVVVG